MPAHYVQGSPVKLLPLGIPHVLIWGQQDDRALLALGEKYAEVVMKHSGDPVQLRIVPGAGHFEPASPLSPTWPVVQHAVRSTLTERAVR